VQPLGHRLPLQVLPQDLLAGNLQSLAILGPPHPPPGQGVFLQLRRSSVKYKDRLYPVEEQLADPVVEPQQVGVRHSIPLPIPEPPDSLVEPDGHVHGQHFM